jgi:hypothetical protein
MASPPLCDDFAATVGLYSTFIKQMKDESPQLNFSEVSFARGKAGKNSFGKHNSSGISNVSNDAVDYRFFEKHTPRIKRLKHGHVENFHSGNGNGTGKNSRNGPTIKSLTHSIA